MLKPTDRPPPSCAPRFAASITPGPPPVTTAQPRSANSRPVVARRGVRRMILADARGAEERDRGPVDLVDAAKPARNSSAISSTASARVGLLGVEDSLVAHD